MYINGCAKFFCIPSTNIPKVLVIANALAELHVAVERPISMDNLVVESHTQERFKVGTSVVL